MQEYWPKRRFTRYPIVLPLLHRSKGPAASTAGVGWTFDLSGGGAGVRLAQRIRPQDSLHVHFQTDCGPIEGEAQVAFTIFVQAQSPTKTKSRSCSPLPLIVTG